VEVVIREYVDAEGRRPFTRWFDRLDVAAAQKVQIALARLRGGNTSALKGVGGGVAEARIDFGPGYRVYLGQDGPAWLLLLGGGTKARQARDIADAQARWRDYKHRK
jgi:putative addiction module killer protein